MALPIGDRQVLKQHLHIEVMVYQSNAVFVGFYAEGGEHGYEKLQRKIETYNKKFNLLIFNYLK